MAQSAQNLLGSILKQLVECHESMPMPAKDAYEHHKRGKLALSTEDIVEMIRGLLKNFRRTFMCIDALDECAYTATSSDGGSRLRIIEDALQNLLKGTPEAAGSISVFATSRFDRPQVQDRDRYTKIEIKAMPEDLRTFIKMQLREDSTSDPWVNSELAALIRENETLIEEACKACEQFSDHM